MRAVARRRRRGDDAARSPRQCAATLPVQRNPETNSVPQSRHGIPTVPQHRCNRTTIIPTMRRQRGGNTCPVDRNAAALLPAMKRNPKTNPVSHPRRTQITAQANTPIPHTSHAQVTTNARRERTPIGGGAARRGGEAAIRPRQSAHRDAETLPCAFSRNPKTRPIFPPRQVVLRDAP